MILTAQQQKMIHPMVVWGWAAYYLPSQNATTAYWNDDAQMPVRIGPVMQSLVDAQLVEKIEGLYGRGVVVYRLTPGTKAKYRCSCLSGDLLNEHMNIIGKCPNCYQGCRKAQIG